MKTVEKEIAKIDRRIKKNSLDHFESLVLMYEKRLLIEQLRNLAKTRLELSRAITQEKYAKILFNNPLVRFLDFLEKKFA